MLIQAIFHQELSLELLFVIIIKELEIEEYEIFILSNLFSS